MPNSIWCGLTVSGSEFKRVISARQRLSQRTVRSIDLRVYSRVEGLAMHSSKAIAMVEPRLDWMRMLSSGPMKILLPSMCD